MVLGISNIPTMAIQLVSNMLPDDQVAARAASPASSRSTSGWWCRSARSVKLIVTSNDVIHAWGVPAFWTKIDAVPGRLNETWFRADRPGVYYGVCYELCGARHGYMPIAVEVVSREQFAPGSPRRAAPCRAPAPGAPPARRADRRRRPRRTAATPAPANTVAATDDAGDHQSKRNHQLRRREQHDRHHRQRRPFRGRSRRTTRIMTPTTSRASSSAGSCRPTTRTSARSI